MKPEQIIKVYAEYIDTGAPSGLPEFNQLRVETVSNGIGNYIVLKTDRWALDEENLELLFLELRDLLKEVN